MRQLSFKRHRFPADIIRHSVWLYARFTLSYRDVEEMLAERGLDISYETVRRRFLKFGSTIAANLRCTRPRPCDHWHLDEMVIVIQRKRYWLWRAVDNEGEGAVTLSNGIRANLAGKFGSRRGRHGLPGTHCLVAKLA
jgi:putative transposase